MKTTSIRISIPEQRLSLLNGERIVRAYDVSTARNGPGEQSGSGCTPRGAHVIRAKIGAGCAHGTVFVGRRPTGDIYTNDAFPETCDLILCRILWLSGCEPGRNRLGPVDTMRRFIYIHGCPDTTPVGVPLSHGCIRMRNADIAELFDMVEAGVKVSIEGKTGPSSGADACTATATP